jgi:hypothetical protein
VIWVGLLILISLVAIFLLIDWHLTAIRQQNSAKVQLLAQLHDDLVAAQSHLEGIERHASRQAKPLYEKDDSERRKNDEDPYYYTQRDGI